MWYREWPVLVVDDEPDILRLSEMVFRNVEVGGVPIKVYTASSKAEAIEVIQNHMSEPAGPGLLTVALIDVVMETDTAGLELCDYIRNTLHNSFAQLYIRTGQPGTAPERAVIDRYDITGYFTKVEATEDKLYSMVKSGVREFVLTSWSMVNVLMVNDMIASSVISQERIGASMQEKLRAIAEQRGVGHDAGMAIWVGETPIVTVGYDAPEAEARRKHLVGLGGTPISPMGDTLTVDADARDSLIYIPAGPDTPDVTFLGTGYSMPHTDLIYFQIQWAMRSLATLWVAAGQRALA